VDINPVVILRSNVFIDCLYLWGVWYRRVQRARKTAERQGTLLMVSNQRWLLPVL